MAIGLLANSAIKLRNSNGDLIAQLLAVFRSKSHVSLRHFQQLCLISAYVFVAKEKSNPLLKHLSVMVCSKSFCRAVTSFSIKREPRFSVFSVVNDFRGTFQPSLPQPGADGPSVV